MKRLRKGKVVVSEVRMARVIRVEGGVYLEVELHAGVKIRFKFQPWQAVKVGTKMIISGFKKANSVKEGSL